MKLRQFVEAGQFIQHEPHGPYRRVFAVAHHAQDEQVEPRRMQRQHLFPVGGGGCQEDPAFALGVLLSGRKSLPRMLPLRQQFQAIGHHVQA